MGKPACTCRRPPSSIHDLHQPVAPAQQTGYNILVPYFLPVESSHHHHLFFRLLTSLFDSNCAGCAYRPTDTFTTAREAGDEAPFTVAVVIDLGLMGADGLSTKVGPYGGAANPSWPQ